LYPVADNGALGHFGAFHYFKHTRLSLLRKIYSLFPGAAWGRNHRPHRESLAAAEAIG
jgi:hypothetical protein